MEHGRYIFKICVVIFLSERSMSAIIPKIVLVTVILRVVCLRGTYYDGRIAKNLKNTHYKKCDIWHLDNLMLKAMPTGARAGEELCLQ